MTPSRTLRVLGAGLVCASLASAQKTPPAPPAVTPAVSRTPAAEDPFARALTAGHPWPYEFAVERAPESEAWSFRSSAPYSGKVHLRFRVSRQDFPSAAEAGKAFDELSARAHPDTGLSYGWDTVLLDGSRLWRLEAPCLYSQANFDRLSANLAGAALERRLPERALRCRCGGGCRLASP